MSGERLRIGDYAAIGDGRTVALVSRTGSLDWLCWPRFDSPATFASLVDPEHGGHFTITPAVPFRSSRAYANASNVLCTRFETAGGELELTDFMPALHESQKRRALHPEHELIRRAVCVRGEVPVRIAYDPRPGFGLRHARNVTRDRGGVRIETTDGLLDLRTSFRLEPSPDGGFVAHQTLRAGDTLESILTLAQNGPAVIPPLGDRTLDLLERTNAYWHLWAMRCAYEGPYREAVVRSALVLKLLGFAPSGAIVAAPTTSLPERIGGDLNWDYRYCWLRDAAFTARALLGLGYAEDADAYISWLLHATRLTWPSLKILYDVYGRDAPRERELAHLAGYEESRPVRTGNEARSQLQLDVYGEVIDAVARACRAGASLDRETGAMLRGLGAYVCRNWQRPDDGIWEPRSGARHHTHSRVLCWTALDRLVELVERGHLRAPAKDYVRHRAAIRAEVERDAWNEKIGSYTKELGGDDVDAALLLLSWYGFEAAGTSRMRGTFARIVDQLRAGPGMLYRYRVPPGTEGAFGICSFWGAEFLASGGGTLEESQRWFESLLEYSNDVGLYGEEFDVDTGEPVGNFPQAFTHVGLVNAALSISERADREMRESWRRDRISAGASP